MASSLAPDLAWLQQFNSSGAVSPDTAAQLSAIYGAPNPVAAPAPAAPPNEVAPIVMDATPVPGNLPPTVADKEKNDAAAMDAVAAYMGGKDPFAKTGAPTALPPENADQLKALGYAPAPMPTAGAALKGVPKVEAETTGFVPPSKMGGAPAPMPMGGGLVGKGGGPGKPLSLADMEARVYSPGQRKLNALGEQEIVEQGKREQSLAEIEAEKAQHEAVLLRNAQEDAENIAEENAAREEQRQKLIAAAHDSLQTKWDELSNTQIDPNRLWNNKDTGEKVMATMGIILAGIGGAISGQGGNVALDRLNAEIGRDVEAQKATYMAKADSLKAQQSLYGQMMAEYGDERMADSATLATHWKMVENQLNVYAAQSQNDFAKQNAMDAAKFASMNVDKYRAGLEAQTEALWKKATAAAGPSPMDKKFQEMDMQGAVMLRDELRKKGIDADVKPMANGLFAVVGADGKAFHSIPGGTGGGGTATVVTGFNKLGQPIYGEAPAASKESAAKLGEASKVYANLKEKTAQLKEMHAKAGSIYDTAEEKAAAEALLASIQSDLAKLENMPLRGEGANILKAQVPTVDEVLHQPWVTSDPAKAKIDQLDKGADSAYGATKAAGGAGAPDVLETADKPSEDEEK